MKMLIAALSLLTATPVFAQSIDVSKVAPSPASVSGDWFGTLRFEGRVVHCWVSSRELDGTFLTRYLTKFRESDEYESYTEQGTWRTVGNTLHVRTDRKNGEAVAPKYLVYSIDRVTTGELWYTHSASGTAFIATRVDGSFSLPARCGEPPK